MVTDTVYVEWHLTPRGWIRGTWSINKPLQSSPPPPDDRVETWVKTETTHNNQFAHAQKEWALTWASSLHSEADRQALRASTRKPVPETEHPKPATWDFPLN
ncbi:MAG: hypothetical protein QM706_16075 [Nitrospira sp.]